MTVAHPIRHALISTGGGPQRHTGARNYDEFADESEITAIIAAQPYSALGVEMPHWAPDSRGLGFAAALPAAASRLAAAQAAGCYRDHHNVVALYRISGDGTVGYGLWCMVDTDQISTTAEESGLIIRNEDVFLDKVRERVALAEAIGHQLSPVLLLATVQGQALNDCLAAAVAQAGPPDVTDVDQAGRAHEVWVVPSAPAAEHLLTVAGSGELVVADGNHRSLAAQLGRLDRFLAVVTTPESVRIQPYNRLVAQLTMPAAELFGRLEAMGGQVQPVPAGDLATGRLQPHRGTIGLYVSGQACTVALPPDPAGDNVENLDHARVERILLDQILGLDAGDKRITYVGGDYPASWLIGQVDTAAADVAILIAPVTVDDFVAVNLARRKLPRKSTWFIPKARAGLVVADLSGLR